VTSTADPLFAAFAGRLAMPLSEAIDRDALTRELVDLIARARREAPGVKLDPLGFAAHVAERVTYDRHGMPVLAAIHAGALWIAYGCVLGDASALAAFETTYAPVIGAALARSFEHGTASDAELVLREKLVLVAGDGAPRLAAYSGRGDLRAWLRAAAVRTAIDLVRARRVIPVDNADLGDAAAVDPVLARLKQNYRDEFRAAFGAAARELTDRERTLLRYRFVDDLSIDEIGLLYKAHRATVARWIAAIREALFERTRAQLMASLDLDDGEVDSVLRLVDSQLEASISAVFGSGGRGGT